MWRLSFAEASAGRRCLGVVGVSFRVRARHASRFSLILKSQTYHTHTHTILLYSSKYSYVRTTFKQYLGPTAVALLR